MTSAVGGHVSKTERAGRYGATRLYRAGLSGRRIRNRPGEVAHLAITHRPTCSAPRLDLDFHEAEFLSMAFADLFYLSWLYRYERLGTYLAKYVNFIKKWTFGDLNFDLGEKYDSNSLKRTLDEQ